MGQGIGYFCGAYPYPSGREETVAHVPLHNLVLLFIRLLVLSTLARPKILTYYLFQPIVSGANSEKRYRENPVMEPPGTCYSSLGAFVCEALTRLNCPKRQGKEGKK